VAGARGGRRRGQQEDEGKQRRGGSHGDQTNVREGVEGLGAAEISSLWIEIARCLF
jgi:hypothetical protein